MTPIQKTFILDSDYDTSADAGSSALQVTHTLSKETRKNGPFWVVTVAFHTEEGITEKKYKFKEGKVSEDSLKHLFEVHFEWMKQDLLLNRSIIDKYLTYKFGKNISKALRADCISRNLHAYAMEYFDEIPVALAYEHFTNAIENNLPDFPILHLQEMHRSCRAALQAFAEKNSQKTKLDIFEQTLQKADEQLNEITALYKHLNKHPDALLNDAAVGGAIEKERNDDFNDLTKKDLRKKIGQLLNVADNILNQCNMLWTAVSNETSLSSEKKWGDFAKNIATKVETVQKSYDSLVGTLIQPLMIEVDGVSVDFKHALHDIVYGPIEGDDANAHSTAGLLSNLNRLFSIANRPTLLKNEMEKNAAPPPPGK